MDSEPKLDDGRLRPSALPKLAACACFVSSPCPSDAAERGTRMDVAFRLRMGGVMEGIAYNALRVDEVEAVRWAVDRVRVLCGNDDVLVDKESCTLEAWHACIQGGEADAICGAQGRLFDLKSGQVRNYWEQQAAYAVSCMRNYFVDEWDAYLLFCDQQVVKHRRFTLSEAEGLCQSVVDSVFGWELAEASVCEYCAWCASCVSCAACNALAEPLVAKLRKDPEALESWFTSEVLGNELSCSQFLDACVVMEDFQKRAKEKALEWIAGGRVVPGYTRSSRRGSESVSAETVGHYIDRLGFGEVLGAYGSLSLAKFRRLWEAKGMDGLRFPEEKVVVGAGSSFLKRAAQSKYRKVNNKKVEK